MTDHHLLNNEGTYFQIDAQNHNDINLQRFALRMKNQIEISTHLILIDIKMDLSLITDVVRHK